MNKGKLLVIEAPDGSGKATQTKHLLENLLKAGKNARQITFPDYDSPSSALVKMYLRGMFGKEATAVNPYAASLFYAVDRYASYKTTWRDFLTEGGIVIADRYVTSNMAHQAVKIADSAEREKFLDWLFDTEYEKLELPKPDAVIFLDMPPKAAQKLIAARANNGEDIHEKDEEYLAKTYDEYSRLAEKYGWERVKCADGEGVPLTINEIAARVWEIAKKILD